MSKIYVLKSYDGFGDWYVEGVYTDFETAKKDLIYYVEKLNQNIKIRNAERETLFTFDDREQYWVSDDSLLSYSNDRYRVDIIELEINQIHSKLLPKYDIDTE